VVEAILLEYGMSLPAAVGMLWPVLLGIQLSSFGTCGEQQSQHVQQHFLAMRVMYIVSNSTNQMYTHSPAFLCLMHAFEDSAFSYKEVQCCICIPRL
jgi:hypothetical protein